MPNIYSIYTASDSEIAEELERIARQLALQAENDRVVYTVNFGDYDDLRPVPKELHHLVDFVSISDRPLNISGWRNIVTDIHYRDSRRTAKIFKVLPHLFLSSYARSTYIDANITLGGEFLRLHEVDGAGGWWGFRHRKRICAYAEAKACAFWGKDNQKFIKNQMRRYQNEGYPRNQGLTWGGLLVRQHNRADIKALSEMWWSEIERGSVRDQLSLDYSAWKCGIAISYFDEKLRVDKVFSITPHVKITYYGDKSMWRRAKIWLGKAATMLGECRRGKS